MSRDESFDHHESPTDRAASAAECVTCGWPSDSQRDVDVRGEGATICESELCAQMSLELEAVRSEAHEHRQMLALLREDLSDATSRTCQSCAVELVALLNTLDL